jgi:tricorn protease-like protein
MSEKIEGFVINIESIQKISDTEVIIGGRNSELRIYNIETGKMSENIEGFGKWIYSIKKISENKFLIGGEEGELKIFKKELNLDSLPDPDFD